MKTFRKRNVFICVLVFLACGCSQSISPTGLDIEATTNSDMPETHGILGMFTFICNPDLGIVDVIPLRYSDFHLNALKFLEPPPYLYLTLESTPHFTGKILDVDIGLRNPNLGLDQFTGFDVSGIFITHGSYTGFQDTDIVIAGEGDTRLLNADGYSRWWNPSEFPHGDKINNYIDGLLGTPADSADFNCTVNGYNFFADGLDKDALLTSMDPTHRCPFRAGQQNIRHYTIDLSAGLIFNYAVDACWKPPMGTPPFTVPDDFPPGANRPEAWNISISELENTLFNKESTGANGGNLSLLLDVWDHYDAGLNTVLVESPGNFDPILTDTPIGGGPGFSTYQVDITDATPQPGSIDILITVEAPIPNPNPYAYFIHKAPVSPIHDVSECEGLDENEPNGECATASPMGIDVPVYGCVQEPQDVWDYWAFDVAVDGAYEIYLYNDGAGDVDLAYYSSDCVWQGSSGLHGAGEDEYIKDLTLTAGAYYASVKADDDSGPYSEERHYRLMVKYHPPIDFSLCIAYYDKTNGALKFAKKETAGGWLTETVDNDGDVGASPCLGMDSTGRPLICYTDVSNSKLKYTFYDGIEWQFPSFPTVNIFSIWDMDIDSTDRPNIVYFLPGMSTVGYAYFDGVLWNTEVAASSVGGTSGGFTLDADDYPHVSYDAGGGTLTHKYKDSMGWHSEFVYYGNIAATESQIAIDSLGHIQIAHTDNYSPLNLYHSWYDGAAWHTEVVAHPGYLPSMRIDNKNNIHIAYQNGSGAAPKTALMYAFYDGSSWTTETVDDSADDGYPSFTVDADCNPHISYYDKTTDDLKYAYHDGSEWQLEIVDSDNDVGSYSSIAISEN